MPGFIEYENLITGSQLSGTDPVVKNLWPKGNEIINVNGDLMEINLTMTRGRDAIFTGTVSFGGVTEDLTGGTLRFMAKWSPSDADNAAAISLTSVASDGISIPTPANGQFTLTIGYTRTEALPQVEDPIVLKYELIYLKSTGGRYRVIHGDLIVNPRIMEST